MARVLFVCLGNICRSPMAEAVFRHKVKEAGLDDAIAIDSAGTAGWHAGKPAHEGTQQLLLRKKVDGSGLVARQFRKADAEAFDYIVAMDTANLSDIRSVIGDPEGVKLVKMLDFHPHLNGGDVPDPYYTGNFDEVYDMLDLSCDALLADIRNRFT